VIFQFAALTNAHWQTSGEVILMTLVGGLGTIFGPVLGAITVGALSHELSAFGSWVQVILGTVFVVCVMVFRRGIVGEIQHRLLKKKADK
jgi:branched-chain amino acid transport system permease protein